MGFRLTYGISINKTIICDLFADTFVCSITWQNNAKPPFTIIPTDLRVPQTIALRRLNANSRNFASIAVACIAIAILKDRTNNVHAVLYGGGVVGLYQQSS